MGATATGEICAIRSGYETENVGGPVGSARAVSLKTRLAAVGVAVAVATAAVVVGTTGVASASSGSIPSSAFQDHTGITKTEVKLANVSTLSIGLFKGATVGAQAYADYVNSTGGINGRKLVITDSDDQFTGATNKQATQNAIDNDFAMVGKFSLEDSFGGALLKTNPGMPNVSVVLDPATNKLPNVYSPVPLNAGWELGPLQYHQEEVPQRHPRRRGHGGRTPLRRDRLGRREVRTGQGGLQGHLRPHLHRLHHRLHPERHRHEERRGQDGLHGLHGRELRRLVPEGPDPAELPPRRRPRCGHLHQRPGQGCGGAAAVNGDYLEQNTSLYLGQDAKAVPAVATFLHWVNVASPGFSPTCTPCTPGSRPSCSLRPSRTPVPIPAGDPNSRP